MRNQILPLFIAIGFSGLTTLTGCFQNQDTASLASNQNFFGGSDVTDATSPEAQKAAGALGARDATQLVMLMADLTEVSVRNASINDIFIKSQDNLPQSASLSAVTGTQLTAHIKLAAEFCRQLIASAPSTAETVARRQRYFPGITFASRATTLTNTQRDVVIQALTQKFYRVTAASAEDITELQNLSNDLITLQRSDVNTGALLAANSNLVDHVMLGLCTAVLASPKATLIF